MEVKWQKSLSENANKMIVGIRLPVASVLRASHRLRRLGGAYATLATQATLRSPMLRRLAAYRNVALLGLSSLSSALALHELTSRTPREAARIVEPIRVTVEDHWRRATGIVTAALSSFQRIKELHVSAQSHLDSADYALTQLLHDLRPVMGLPADVSGLRAVLAEAERNTRPRRLEEAIAA
jgi:hypothetical protein